VFEEAMERVQQSPKVYRPAEGRYAGALVIVTDEGTPGEDEPKAEVLIRSNGIPTYVGKDIAYHMWKFGLLPERIRYVEFCDQPNGEKLWSTSLTGENRSSPNPDRVINVIAVNQTLPQQAVNQALRVAGFEEAADRLLHLAYGLVSTRDGRISGRKGTTVSADAVIDEAVRVALERVKEKRSADMTEDEMEKIAEAVGVGAVRYFMVQYNPLRDIVFDVSDVVSYDGNTGLYIQYALVRMSAILRRAFSDHGVTDEAIDAADSTLLQHEQEQRLVFHLAQYPDAVATAARTLAVNLIAEYAYDLATIFSQFYRDCGVLNAEPGLREARLLLVRTVRSVLANACELLGVPVIERL
jgi:arginyl-tRNA synthetase